MWSAWLLFLFLYDAGCKAELTASARCGFHKYTFNKEHDESRFLISLNYPTEYKLNLKEGYIKKCLIRQLKDMLV